MKKVRIKIRANKMTIRFNYGAGTVGVILALPATMTSFQRFSDAVVEAAIGTGYSSSKHEATKLVDRAIKLTEQYGIHWDDAVKIPEECDLMDIGGNR